MGLRTDGQRSIQTERQSAVDKAWEREVELVRVGKGTRQWTAEEQKELLSTGKVEGYFGHHMQSVKTNPENAGNMDNIQFLNHEEHIQGAHQGNTKNSTNGYFDPETGKMHEFKDGNVKPITPMDLREKAFENEKSSEQAYQEGKINRFNAKKDIDLANYAKNLDKRDDLDNDVKAARLDKMRQKYENQKKEYEKMVQEKNDNNNLNDKLNSNRNSSENLNSNVNYKHNSAELKTEEPKENTSLEEQNDNISSDNSTSNATVGAEAVDAGYTSDSASESTSSGSSGSSSDSTSGSSASGSSGSSSDSTSESSPSGTSGSSSDSTSESSPSGSSGSFSDSTSESSSSSSSGSSSGSTSDSSSSESSGGGSSNDDGMGY